MRRAGVDERCTVVAGSFFETVPAGRDAYVLKNVVHDWPDEHAVAILRACRAGITESATLQLVERLIQAPNEGPDAALSDLNMLVSPGGQERTEAEYAALLATAGAVGRADVGAEPSPALTSKGARSSSGRRCAPKRWPRAVRSGRAEKASAYHHSGP